MARLERSDWLHSFRFHVRTELGFTEFIDSDLGEAGFSNVTTPEYTVETVEYREGIHTYTKKQSGIPTTNTLTLSRGVTKRDTAFYDWVVAAIEGGEYRTNLTIYHWHRDGKVVDKPADLEASKKYEIENAIPGRIKPAGDLDGTASEINISEVDVDFEKFTIVDAA